MHDDFRLHISGLGTWNLWGLILGLCVVCRLMQKYVNMQYISCMCCHKFLIVLIIPHIQWPVSRLREPLVLVVVREEGEGRGGLPVESVFWGGFQMQMHEDSTRPEFASLPSLPPTFTLSSSGSELSLLPLVDISLAKVLSPWHQATVVEELQRLSPLVLRLSLICS